MNTTGGTVLVVGAGVAGLRACESLRQLGFDGRIVLVGDEPHLPYDRPPLSKQFLAGKWELDRLLLRPPEAIDALGLERLLGPYAAARSLDLERRVVGLASGDEVAFDGLVVASGAVPRRLPGTSELAAAHVLRTVDDALRLREALADGARLLVVGAGFIGLEVAATARGLGCEVDVVDPLPIPLRLAVGDAVGSALRRMHEAEGVRFHLSSTLERVEERPDATLAAELSDGSSLVADAVLVGIGVEPAVGWLAGSGIEAGRDGVVCDATLRAAPGVVAAGDLARFPMGRPSPATVRVEHRTTAAELGDHAARTLLAELAGRDHRPAPARAWRTDGSAPEATPFDTVLYVWSDQYDVKIQVIGHPSAADEVAVVEGSLDERRFVVCYGRDGLLTGVLAVGRPRHLIAFRPLLARGASFDEARSFRPA